MTKQSDNKPLIILNIIYFFGLIYLPITINAQEIGSCNLDNWVPSIIKAWDEARLIDNADCYRGLVQSMDHGRKLRDDLITEFDKKFPRAGYKVVGLDPINAALPGVDRPMVGAMYVSMFLPNKTSMPISSAEILITEPDFIFSVSSEAINEAETLEDVIQHVDRIYAFIETLAPTFINTPPNPYLMQASNLMAHWGVIGESIAVEPTKEFLNSLETMTVTFQDGNGNILARQPGSYLGKNPLNGALVVIKELKRRGEKLMPGDLISSGSYMPPILVTEPIEYKTIYEGIGGKTISVSTSFYN
jgi:2-keto-4-pentenoate hydratase